MSDVVTRFAPSPTGSLHIGGARTALFSWLLARHNGGRFLLRIEDTDQARSSAETTQAILDSLTWLGLDWDGEPVYQSARFGLHNEYIDRLLASGHAYWCECTTEEVEAMREEARSKGLKPKYNGRCRERDLGPGEGRVVRFKTPLDGETVIQDMVKGTVTVANAEMDDMVLRRPDGSPTYNLAVVADDSDMGVTHVLRGDDHLNNTPRQTILYQALGLPLPCFGHVPLIHGQDKKKLSKRHGARSVAEYREDGILPEALVNYLARLGWSHGDQEIFSKQELIDAFTPDNLNASAAAFDPDKLLWLNAHYIKEMDPEHLAVLLAGQLQTLGYADPDLPYLKSIVPLYQPRAKTLVEMAEGAAFFVTDDDALEYDEAASAKFLTTEAKEHLARVRDRLTSLTNFDKQTLEENMGAYLEEAGIKFKILAQPLRVAITGKTASPGLFETMEVLGKDRTLRRLNNILERTEK